MMEWFSLEGSASKLEQTLHFSNFPGNSNLSCDYTNGSRMCIQIKYGSASASDVDVGGMALTTQ